MSLKFFFGLRLSPKIVSASFCFFNKKRKTIGRTLNVLKKSRCQCRCSELEQYISNSEHRHCHDIYNYDVRPFVLCCFFIFIVFLCVQNCTHVNARDSQKIIKYGYDAVQVQISVYLLKSNIAFHLLPCVQVLKSSLKWLQAVFREKITRRDCIDGACQSTVPNVVEHAYQQDEKLNVILRYDARMPKQTSW